MNYYQMINSRPVVLVEFYASWCPHCRAMMPIVEQVKQLIDGRVEVYQLDIDLNEEASKEAGVEGVPTFLLYKNGKLVWTESGEMSGDFLLGKMESFL